MKIDTLKEFEKLVKLCRKLGVDAIEADGVKFNLGAEPRKPSKPFEIEDPLANARIEIPDFTKENTVHISSMSDEVKAQVEKIATEELTEEQLMFFSVKQEPGQDQPQ